MDNLPTRPDLTRLSKKLGEFNNDIDIVNNLKSFKDKIYRTAKTYGKRNGAHDSKSVIDLVFNGKYSLEDISYRSEILQQLIENPKMFNFWNKQISMMELYQTRLLYPDDTDQYGRRLEPSSLVNIARRSTMKWLNLPKTIDDIINMPQITQGVIDLSKFAQETKDLLKDFYKLTQEFEKEPIIITKNNEKVVDFDKHNEFITKINDIDMEPVRNFVKIRHDMAYYKAMTIPYLTKLLDGTKIISSKPLFVDKELKIANFVNAYNPKYFKVDTHYKSDDDILKLNVPNDFEFNDEKRTTFVLGPNNRGKSVYLNTIGLNIMLAMNGSYTFSEKSTMSEIDNIYTCFDMGDSLGSGHFYTGAKRLQHMRDNVTPYSIVLVDETGGGTEPRVESWIAKGVADTLIENNISNFYITHEKGIWNNYLDKKNIAFLRTSDLGDDNRLYEIFPGIAKGGYGEQIARNLGIDPKTLNDTIKNRFKNQK